MHIREATDKDKEAWNSFIDKQNGNFYHYFDWKYVYEISNCQYIPLIIENSASEIIGIFPLTKIGHAFYSKLVSLPKGTASSFLFKNNLESGKIQRAILDV